MLIQTPEVKTPIIKVRNLEKSYGVNQVLRGINMDVYPGQIVGYIGPNGAGKSTTVKILTGLIEEYSGEIEINGRPLNESIQEVKSIIGYVPENAELYDVLTPLEYLDFIGKLYMMDEKVIFDRANKLLASFGLSAYAGKRMDTFSKGMRQKVLLISGILHNPKILILDEPLSGLDANSVILVKEVIYKLAKAGKTIFYCSHMMDVVEKVSDRILVINQGEIVANGTFDELKEREGETLEKIFTKLTGKEDSYDEAQDIINALE